MALIKTADDIKKYITIDGSFDFKTVMPYIELAEDDVKRVLGKGQYTELNDYYNAANSGIAELDELLSYAQRPVVYFAFLKGLDKFNVSIGNNGIGVIHNTQLAPASTARVESLRKNIDDSVWDALEYLLEFLEENNTNYPAWEASEAYSETYKYLITSARQFDDKYKIKRSRLTFLEWRPTMDDVETLVIIPAISQEMVDELKSEMKAGTVSVANQKILPLLQKALAYLTAAKKGAAAIPPTPAITEPSIKWFNQKGDKTVQAAGETYLMMAKKIMDAAPDNYPTYKASSVYLAATRPYTPYANDDTMNIAVFG